MSNKGLVTSVSVQHTGTVVFSTDVKHGAGTRRVSVEVPKESVAKLAVCLMLPCVGTHDGGYGHAGWHYNGGRLTPCKTHEWSVKDVVTLELKTMNLERVAVVTLQAQGWLAQVKHTSGWKDIPAWFESWGSATRAAVKKMEIHPACVKILPEPVEVACGRCDRCVSGRPIKCLELKCEDCGQRGCMCTTDAAPSGA